MIQVVFTTLLIHSVEWITIEIIVHWMPVIGQLKQIIGSNYWQLQPSVHVHMIPALPFPVWIHNNKVFSMRQSNNVRNQQFRKVLALWKMLFIWWVLKQFDCNYLTPFQEYLFLILLFGNANHRTVFNNDNMFYELNIFLFTNNSNLIEKFNSFF